MEFLRQIVDDLAERRIDFAETVIITPNRRAGLFLKKYIQEDERIRKPVWLPQLFSINDFISTVSNLDLLDRFSLVFELYPIYTSCFPSPRSFDTYYQWGNIVLADFNEIDLYLVDQNNLFKHLKDLSELDKGVNAGSTVMSDFILFSENLQVLYDRFRTFLLQKRQAWYGLALRQIVESFDPALFGKWKRIVFAGFNALTTAERGLLEKLQSNGLAEIYWDIDNYFYDDEQQEAGVFLRSNPLISDKENCKWISDDLISRKKDIEIIAASGRVAQAKVLGSLLQKTPDADLDDTAVVLGDEGLLFPLLHSLPDHINRINVTMGYPLKNTSLYHLINNIIELHNQSRSDAGYRFRFYHVNKILLHPYILPLAQGAIRELTATAGRENRAFLESSELQALESGLEKIFSPIANTNAFIKILRDLFIRIVNQLRDQPDSLSFEIEYIYQFLTRLQRLEDIITEYDIKLELKTFWNLFKEVLDTSSVPFVGEPLQGLQVMGLLETRTLDFKNVYILSANEGVLPGGKQQNSFIPHEVKKQMKMQAHDHEDSIFAYYFYRILKRAEKVTIFYNTENDAFGKGERSRFIDQLLQELPVKNSTAVISHTDFNIDTVFDKRKEISVEKSSSLLQKMENMIFSPTRLQTWVDCSLKFYFRYLLKLTEQDDVIEAADAPVFGNVLHDVLDRLYSQQLGVELTRQQIDEMLLIHEQVVRDVYQEKMGSVDIKKGRNFLYVNILTALVGIFLKNEKVGKTVLETEKKITKNIKIKDVNIRLTGNIDRIERQGDVVDIIDFKTGNINSIQFDLNLEMTLEELKRKFRKNSQLLQLLFYYYLSVSNICPQEEIQLRLGIYSFKKQKGQGKISFFSVKKNKIHYLSANKEDARITGLLEMIFTDVFEPSRSFQQTEDSSKCSYCPYSEICGDIG